VSREVCATLFWAGRQSRPQRGRPPLGGIAGAAEARLRGVEPDVLRGGGQRRPHPCWCTRSNAGSHRAVRVILPGFWTGGTPMLSTVHRSAAFFDLDKTIIARSSALAFGRPFRAGGLINRRAALKAAYAQLVYLVAGADEDQMVRMRDYITEMCTGWDVQQVKDIVAETLFEIVDPLIYDEAAGLIEDHKASGREVVIVSSSGEEVVGPIGELVGADRVIATRMVVADGRYTGQVDYYAYGPTKAAAMRELAEAAGYDLADCYAYSDSITDLPMLEAVGHPAAVNPDRALRRAARERDWPILVFTRPVSLRSRLAGLRGSRTPMVGTAVGVGAAVAGIAWYAARRRTAPPARGVPDDQPDGRRGANAFLMRWSSVLR
jgi:HAD superfamily hydrolase (TIGR01490 family)